MSDHNMNCNGKRKAEDLTEDRTVKRTNHGQDTEVNASHQPLGSGAGTLDNTPPHQLSQPTPDAPARHINFSVHQLAVDQVDVPLPNTHHSASDTGVPAQADEVEGSDNDAPRGQDVSASSEASEPEAEEYASSEASESDDEESASSEASEPDDEDYASNEAAEPENEDDDPEDSPPHIGGPPLRPCGSGILQISVAEGFIPIEGYNDITWPTQRKRHRAVLEIAETTHLGSDLKTKDVIRSANLHPDMPANLHDLPTTMLEALRDQAHVAKGDRSRMFAAQRQVAHDKTGSMDGHLGTKHHEEAYVVLRVASGQ